MHGYVITGVAMGASQTCGRITSLRWAWWAEIFTTPTSSLRGLWMRLRSAIRASRSGCTCFTRLFTLVDTASMHYTHLLLCCQNSCLLLLIAGGPNQVPIAALLNGNSGRGNQITSRLFMCSTTVRPVTHSTGSRPSVFALQNP